MSYHTICPLCGEEKQHCPHSESARLHAELLKQEQAEELRELSKALDLMPKLILKTPAAVTGQSI